MNTVRILLVEDESIIALDVKYLLTILGYDVVGVVATGEEAVQMAKDLAPDLVLMDIILEGEMDGIEAARILHSAHDIPVVFMTAHADVATVCRARDTAPYGYIIKPINQSDIFSTIDAAMNRHYLEMELREKNMQLQALNEEFVAANEELEASNEEFQVINEELISSQEELREANIRARLNEAKYRALVEGANSIIMQWNREGYISFINEYGLGFFGFSKEELLGQKITDTFICPVENADGVSVDIAGIFDNPDAFTANINEIIRKDGDRAWISWTNRAVYDERGRIVEVLSIGNDITPLKQTEKELEKSRIQYEKLVADIPVGVYRFRTGTEGNMRFEYVSPRFCEQVGMSSDVVYQDHDNLFRLVHPDEYDELLRKNAEAAQKGDPFMWEGRIYPDGVERWIRIESSPTILENGDILWNGIQIDITERRLADNALKKKNAELEMLNDRLDATIQALEIANQDIASANAEMLHTQGELTESLAMLTRSEERFHKAFHANPTAMTLSVLDDGTYIEVNDTALRYGGFTRDEMTGARIADLGIYTFAELAEMTEHVKRHGMMRNYGVRFRRKSGELRDAIINADIIDLEGVKHLISSTVDITEKKIAEDELRRVNALFTTIFNLAPEIMAVSKFDDGYYLMVNDAFVDILGYRRDEVIGKRSVDLDVWISPLERKDVIHEFNNAGYLKNRELLFRKKNGDTINVLCSASIIEMNDTRCILTLATDITEMKRTELALRENEERYRSLVENSGEGIAVIQDYSFRFINPAMTRIVGWSLEEMLSMNPIDLIYSDDVPMVSNNLERRIEGEDVVHAYDFRMVRKDGAVIWIHVHAVLIQWEGRPAALDFFSDITEKTLYEQGVHENEIKYHTLFESAYDAILIMDKNGIFRDCNSKSEEIYGISRDRLIGSNSANISPLLQPDGIPSEEKVLMHISSAFSEGSKVFEWVHIRGDATVFDAEVSLIKMRIADEDLLMAMVRDITDRKKAETAVRDSEVLYRAIFENTGNATIIIDEDTTIMLANSQWEKMSGYRKEELEGILSWTHFVVPEDLERMKQYHRKRRESPDNAPWMYEFRYITKNGEVRNVINHVAVIPGTRKSIASLLDITERKMAEKAIRESEDLYRAIFENNGNATLIIDEDTTIILANSQWEKISGYRKEELEGIMPWTDFVVPEDLERMKEYHRKRREAPDNAPRQYEFRYITKDREVRNAINHVAMIPGTRKSIASLLDITDRKKAESELVKSLQEKDVLIKEIHHRVKNNLQVISSLLGLQSDSVEDVRLKEAFMESRNRIRGMAQIHELLYQSESFNSINFATFIKKVTGELYANYHVAELNIDIRFTLDTVMIGIDTAIPLGIILNEMMTNVMKYAFRGKSRGVIDVTLNIDKGDITAGSAPRLYLGIRDDGTGMPPGFDVNSQSGLGLSMVRLLAEQQLGGRFALESGNPGTLVFIEIPFHGS